MTSMPKRLTKMRRRPGGWPFEKLHSLLVHHRFILERHEGSHYWYEHPLIPGGLLIVKRNPVNEVYVRRAVKRIEEVIRIGKVANVDRHVH